MAGYRRIGILKSIGFTPGQVVAAYTSQAMVPAAAGLPGRRGAGQPAGRAAARQDRERVRGGRPGRAGVGGRRPYRRRCACLVGIAALLPALRAGRLSAVQAIAAGPRAPPGPRLRRAPAARPGLPLPRPVTIGLAAPVRPPGAHGGHAGRRPARRDRGNAHGRPERIAEPGGGRPVPGQDRASAGRVSAAGGTSVGPGGPGRGEPAGSTGRRRAGSRASAGRARRRRPPPQQRAVAAALRAQPGTLHYVAEADQQVSVAGIAQQIPVTAYRGNAGWTGYGMISGHWYTGPDQVDVPTYFLTVTGKAVGDTVTITFGGRQIPVRIVGRGLRLRQQRAGHDHRLADAGPRRPRPGRPTSTTSGSGRARPRRRTRKPCRPRSAPATWSA